jgi:hypothetical protein
MVGAKMTGEARMRIGLGDCGLPLRRTTWTNAEIAWEIDARVTSPETHHIGLPESPSDRVRYRSGRVGESLEDDSHPYQPELGSAVQGT